MATWNSNESEKPLCTLQQLPKTVHDKLLKPKIPGPIDQFAEAQIRTQQKSTRQK